MISPERRSSKRGSGACSASSQSQGSAGVTAEENVERPPPRIRLGMIGGGEGAFIGAVHRIAARLDDGYEFVAGALSSTPDKARRSAAALGLAPARSYADVHEMLAAEVVRPDGIEVAAIVTPNHLHAPA